MDEPKVQLNRPISFHRRLRIEPGRKRDYEAFAGMHYRATDELGFVDKVFVMRDGRAGDLLGTNRGSWRRRRSEPTRRVCPI